MIQHPYNILAERPVDAAAIDSLHELAFGPGRFARAASILREGTAHDAALSFVALAGERMIGSVRLTPIRIGGRPALLLGPLAVVPEWKGRGAGKALMRTAVAAAAAAGHQVILLVGDEPYYGPFGFRPLAPYRITLPAPADPARVLVCGLVEGALDGLSGMATRA
ncbi:GNAT family N-acetyltransferase [Prosthecomicrobium pneumaticum]|uniref:Putative N-acetyltransferase YhbS n=1 Tax=Prosthecomicrobium pneumaticum TaxID=81895 RepID=A0A7W9FLD8_9HYPH|nr:N-acetyltransferase [Prosthecomicrobium pneumaticum]MBB5752805.1 putative N-acetyltransferase YhbS [Prosthecomicrobium pneumaticum]